MFYGELKFLIWTAAPRNDITFTIPFIKKAINFDLCECKTFTNDLTSIVKQLNGFTQIKNKSRITCQVMRDRTTADEIHYTAKPATFFHILQFI